MLMSRRLVIVISIVFLVIVGGYLYFRFGYLKVEDFKPDTAKQKNFIDIRPAIIAKLQQLVKTGSNGLYILSVEKLEPDILNSKLDVSGATIRIDTSAMLRLDSLRLLPDDIFTFRFSSLHIDGLGIDDLLNKDQLEISGIKVTSPLINVYHKRRLYNQEDRRKNDTLSLYEKLKGQMKKIAIEKIEIVHGSFINHDLDKKRKSTKFSDVSILVNDLLVDSSSQHDKSRFLFSKHATLKTKNYSIATADSLYYFKAGNISISGEQHTITALNVELKPRYNREQFEKKLHYGKDMYHLVLPKVTLKDVNWQALINNEKIISNEAEISGGTFTIFFDRSLPQPPVKFDNFPHQALMQLPFPLSIKKINVRHVNFSYEEHNPLTDKNGTIYFDNLVAQINNVSNIATEIKNQPSLNFSATALFMHHVPFAAQFKFDLTKYRTGEFNADIKIGSLDKNTINPVAEPLGLFSLKSGQMQKAIVHVAGNNFNTKGNISMYYSNLKITPLKKDAEGNLKKKSVTGILANIILIKNDNPKGKELRQPDFTVIRTTHKNFFNLLWKSILTGVIKTVGIPEKFAEKKN